MRPDLVTVTGNHWTSIDAFVPGTTTAHITGATATTSAGCALLAEVDGPAGSNLRFVVARFAAAPSSDAATNGNAKKRLLQQPAPTAACRSVKLDLRFTMERVRFRLITFDGSTLEAGEEPAVEMCVAITSLAHTVDE